MTETDEQSRPFRLTIGREYYYRESKYATIANDVVVAVFLGLAHNGKALVRCCKGSEKIIEDGVDNILAPVQPDRQEVETLVTTTNPMIGGRKLIIDAPEPPARPPARPSWKSILTFGMCKS